MHPSDGELLLSAEAGERGVAPQVRSHLAACSRCAGRLHALLEELEETARALEALDGPAPKLDVRTLMARARSESAGSMLPEERRAPSGIASPALSRFPARAAAIAALLAVAGVAAALPGSPVRRLLEGPAGESTSRAPVPAPTPPAADVFAGVALSPDEPLEVVLPESVAQGVLTLVSADEELVRVRSSDPATGFSIGPGVLTLDTRAATLEIELASPARLARLVVRVGDRVVFDGLRPFSPAALPPGDTARISFGGR